MLGNVYFRKRNYNISSNAMIVYHGTNTIVKHPEVRISGYNKDFGFDFYCTQYERQAKQWTLTQRGMHIVCVYEYKPNLLDLLNI